MASHIIVIFDRSGSMASPFTVSAPENRARPHQATHTVKIEEAKAAFLSWLETADYNKATIVAFSDSPDNPQTVLLPGQLPLLAEYLRTLTADGGTRLAAAIEVAFSVGNENLDDYVRYLIVTDGLSHTRDRDIELVRGLRRDQGIEGILIDPTPEGESHLRQLCIRGRYEPIYAPEHLRSALAQREEEHRVRAAISERHNADLRNLSGATRRLEVQATLLPDEGRGAELKEAAGRIVASARNAVEESPAFRETLAEPDSSVDALRRTAAEVSSLASRASQLLGEVKGAILANYADEKRKLVNASGRLRSEASLLPNQGEGAELKRSAERIRAETVEETEDLAAFKDELNLPDPDVEVLRAKAKQLSALASHATQVLNDISAELSRFRVSLSYPRHISSGLSSTFLVQIYPSRRRQYAARQVDRTFRGTEIRQEAMETELQSQMRVRIMLSSPVMMFSDPVRKAISSTGSDTAFWGKPLESATPGEHTGVLSIRDEYGDQELLSVSFKLTIVDYAFDHVSRPAVGHVTSATLGAASISVFIFGLVTQTAQVLGAVGGAIGGALSVFIFARVNAQYRSRALSVQETAQDPSLM